MQHPPIIEEHALDKSPPITNAEVGLVHFDDLKVSAADQLPCDTWKNCTLTYQLKVRAPNNELLSHEGRLHTSFMPGMSTAICMTSNLQFDPEMTPEDVQRVTLAAMIRDRPAAIEATIESLDETISNSIALQSMAIFEQYQGRIHELWRDMPGWPSSEDGEESKTSQESAHESMTFAEGGNSSSGDSSNSENNPAVFSHHSEITTSTPVGSDEGERVSSDDSSPDFTRPHDDSDSDSTDHESDYSSDSDTVRSDLDSTSVKSDDECDYPSRAEMLIQRQLWVKAHLPRFLTCSYCPRKGFKSLARYAEHLDIQHDGLYDKHLCSFKRCPRSVVGFRNIAERTQHVNTCHRGHDRLFRIQLMKWSMRRRQLTQDPPSVQVHVYGDRIARATPPN